VVFEDARPEIEFARRRIEAGPSIGAQAVLEPLVIIHQGGVDLDLATGGADLFRAMARALEHEADHSFLALRIERSVAQPVRQLGHDQVVVACLAHRLDEALADPEGGAVDHVG